LAASAISSVTTVQAQPESANERPVPIDEIPAPARDAIMRHVGAGKLMAVREETGQGGEPVYTARIVFGEYKVIISVDGAGNVLALHRIA
jgi:hypothetical protein